MVRQALEEADIDLFGHVADVEDKYAVLRLLQMLRREHVFRAGRGGDNVRLRDRVRQIHHLPAVITRLQRTRRIDFRHHHLAAVGSGRGRRALPDQAVTDHQHTLLVQRQMGGLEEGMPGGQPNHVPVMQPFFHRQIVPVEDRVARRHAVQPADA